MASSDSQIDKSQRGRPKRAELPNVNINKGAQNINTERAFRPGLGTLRTSGQFRSRLLSWRSKCRIF